jgi:hypothetical protein
MADANELTSILKSSILKLDRFIGQAESRDLESGKGLIVQPKVLLKAKQLKAALSTYHEHEENYPYWCRRHRADEIIIYLVIAMFVFGGLAALILFFWWL